jgi:hypothetical protein
MIKIPSMLVPGAARVFRLRALKTHLEEGIAALLDTIGDDVVLVCESNSLRRVAEPGVFVSVEDVVRATARSLPKTVLNMQIRLYFSMGTNLILSWMNTCLGRASFW